MDTDWTQFENSAYWSVFIASFLGVALWETYRPRGSLMVPPGRRWKNHAAVLILSHVVSFALLRGSPVILAASLAGSSFGLLQISGLPTAARWILAFVLLDLVRYATHRAFHAWPLLWRVHQVHHSDPDFDVSTGFRFHPLEVVISHVVFLVAILALAPPAGAVLLSELVSTFQNFFEHANVSLPRRVQGWVGAVFFTPDTHRIHHSEKVFEQNRNFGQLLTWWDRFFSSYSGEPAAGRDGLVVGLRGFQNGSSLDLAFMLAQPFRRERMEEPSTAPAARRPYEDVRRRDDQPRTFSESTR